MVPTATSCFGLFFTLLQTLVGKDSSSISDEYLRRHQSAEEYVYKHQELNFYPTWIFILARFVALYQL